MTTFYIVCIGLFIIFPIASLDRNVNWPLLFKFLTETVVVFIVFSFLLLPVVQHFAQIGTGDGGAIVFWLVVLGVVTAIGEFVGYSRYKHYMKQYKAGTLPPRSNSLKNNLFAALKRAFWILLSFIVAVMVIGGPKFDIPDRYIPLFHYSLVTLALVSASLWQYHRA